MVDENIQYFLQSIKNGRIEVLSLSLHSIGECNRTWHHNMPLERISAGMELYQHNNLLWSQDWLNVLHSQSSEILLDLYSSEISNIY